MDFINRILKYIIYFYEYFITPDDIIIYKNTKLTQYS